MAVNVLVACSDYLRGGGVTRVALRWCALLPGHRFEFLDAGQILAGASASPPGPCHRIALWPAHPLVLARGVLALATAPWLRRAALVHVHHRRVLVALRLARWIGRHRFALVYTQHLAFPVHPLFRPFLPSATTAVGPEVADSLAVARRTPAIGNPVPFPPAPTGAPDSLRAVVVARLEPQKDLATLLHAWALLRARGVRARLDVLGEGEQGDCLRTLARDLGLEGVVAFHGFVGDVEARFAGALFAVLPTRLEGLPTVVVEAAAQGRATLVSDAPGTADCVPADARLPNRPRPGDAAALADALAAWFSDPVATLAEGRRFRSHHRRLNAPGRVAARLARVYRRALERRP